MAASTLKSLARELAAAKKRLASLMGRFRKAKAKTKTNGKAKPKAKAPTKRIAGLLPAPKRDPKRDVRHDLGKAQLNWHPWELLRDGTKRWARYGIGLNGENKGASVIVLFAEPSEGAWRWEVYPKNDYGDLLPTKFASEMVGTSSSAAAAKLAAEKVVGL